MKNPAFGYARPETLDEALELLAANEDAKLLAGGQSLLPVLALRLGSPELVVDINRIPGLDTLAVDDDGTVHIGALVRHAEVEDSVEIARAAPLVSQAMAYVGHRAIRNQGTTVGSIAHGDPAAEMPAVCLATGATMIAASVRGQREIDAADFFTGFLDTALEPDEVLVEVQFPPWPSGATGCVIEESRRHGDYAVVGLAAAIAERNGTVADVALSFFSVGLTPQRAKAAEDVLVGSPLTPATINAAAAIVGQELTPPADIHGSSNYRRHLASVLTKRALSAALSSEQVAS